MKRFLNKIIAPVPVELKEQFDDIQLRDCVRKLRILSFIAFLAKLINEIPGLFDASLSHIENFNLPEIIEIAVIIIFNCAVILLRKTNRKIILWIICHLLIVFFLILYSINNIYSAETANQVPFIFFITLFLFTIIPDFKPVIFITFSTLYYLSTVIFLLQENQMIGEYLGEQSHIMNIFLIVLITKILLYNSKVKNFVLNSQLKNYNENLEVMVKTKTKTIVELKNAVMETIAELVERRDDITGGHICRTSKYLKMVIDEILKNNLYKKETASWNIEQMILSAQLHDVGKIAIDDSILRKPDKLTGIEFEVMKKHTLIGGEIIKEIQKKTGESEFLDYAYLFAVYHHEKWDGSGYPYRLTGENIPLPARLMAIIDVYDALISERPYKKAFTHEEALKIIKDGSGSHFDPALTKIFLSVMVKL